MRQKHWLILYDIKNTKRLAKVEKCVSSYAWRVQKSVFESTAPESSIIQMKNSLKDIINEEEDFILFFDVCEKDWQKQEQYGKEKGSNVNIQNDKVTIL